MILSLLAAVALVTHPQPGRDTVRVWEAVLRAIYDSSAPTTLHDHPPGGVMPWLSPVVHLGDSAHRDSMSLDSTWLRRLVRDGVIRGICSTDCTDTRDPLRITLSVPEFHSPSAATVVLTYVNVVTDSASPACGRVDFDEVAFRLVRGDVEWHVTARSFLGGGSGIMFSSGWDALCRRTPRPEAIIARMAGEWDIRLRDGTSKHRGDSVDILGHMTVPDSTVRERAPPHVFQARGAYELNPIPVLTGLAPWCVSHRGSIGIYTVEGDADSLHMEFSPGLSTDFECLITVKVVARRDSLVGAWCNWGDRGCPPRGSVSIWRRHAP